LRTLNESTARTILLRDAPRLRETLRKKSQPSKPKRTSELEARRKAATHVGRLEKLIARSGLSDGEIEGALGWPASRLKRTLARRSSIRVEDIVAILLAIDVEPGTFFTSLESHAEPR
jgi:hypothetical protein